MSIVMGSPVWEVQGVDVSKWNGNMNFAVTKTKCQYGLARYGYGDGWKDPKIDEYYTGANANDFPLGGYWFNYIGKDLNAHAQGFAEEIRNHPPKVGIRLDFEWTSLGMQDTLDWMIALDKKVTQLTGLIAEVYSAIWFWDSKVAPTTYFSGRMNWPANWTTRDYPSLPRGWTKWGDWQFSADGNRKGAEYGSTNGDADMDLNRSFYTVVQFNAKYGTHIVPIGGTPPPPPGTLPPYVIINTAELAIHSTPQAVQTNIIGHALQGSKWYPLEEVVSGISWYRLANGAYISKGYTKYP